MKAVNHFIVVENIKNPEKKVAGLFVTEELDTEIRYTKAKIITIGNLVEELKDSDVIYYDKNAGHGITWKDKLYHVIRSGDVVLVE